MKLKGQFRTFKHTVLAAVQDTIHPSSKRQDTQSREQLYYTFTKDGELIAVDENGQILDHTA